MKYVRWILAGCLMVMAGCGRGKNDEVVPAAKGGPVQPSGTHSDDLFTTAGVVRIEIEIPRQGMSQLRRTQWGGGGGEDRPIAKATVKEGGVVYNNVAVHLKGAAGSFRPVDDHPALTLNFDKFMPGQSFHGLHKISLNNSVQDPSCLSEKICRELFDAAGVPVPRAGHALVKLNGRDLGLYVVLEGANKQFLKRYFKNTKGNLFDGGFVHDVDVSLAVNSGDNPEDRSGLEALIGGLRQARSTRSLEPLETVLDLDRFISMMAMEVITYHWDGYSMNRNNWRVFHDLDTKKMVFIPHGLDQMFGSGRGGGRGDLGTPSMSGEVSRVILSTAEGRRRYRERFGQLFTNVFKIDDVLKRLDEMEQPVHNALVQTDSSRARNQEHQLEWLKQRILRRGQEMQRQLTAPPSPLKFGSDGFVKLSGWKRSTVRSGDPDLPLSKDATGRVLLGIKAGSETSSGSWRTRAVLAAGEYRFEGKIKVTSVASEAGDQRAGAGLRISKGPIPRKLLGTADWTNFSYAFQVEEESSEVELICELARASAGEAWFDASTLRLVRTP